MEVTDLLQKEAEIQKALEEQVLPYPVGPPISLHPHLNICLLPMQHNIGFRQ